jgi:acyl-CoA synthetase (AMP-forming)/AMP-acid ligase II
VLSWVHVLEWRSAVTPEAVALTDGLDPAELIDWAHQRLAGFRCPTGVSVVAQLPRNATGKVLRSALREPFWAGRDRRVS